MIFQAGRADGTGEESLLQDTREDEPPESPGRGDGLMD